MNILRRLATEREQDASQRRAAFAAFWTVNAGTTALFGYRYLPALFSPFAELLPIAAETALALSGIMGAVAALAVLDCAYTAWNRIKLHDCETQEQYKWAQSAEQVSFTLSLVFSAIILLTVSFAHLLSPELLAALNNTGAVAFVGVTIFHLIAWQQWKANSIHTRETATQVIIDGQRNSEELAYQRRLNRSAVLKAAEIAEADEEELSDAIGRAWGQRMKESIVEQYQIQPTQTPQLPAPSSSAEPPNTDQLTGLLARADAGTLTPADTATINALYGRLGRATQAPVNGVWTNGQSSQSADFLAANRPMNGHNGTNGHRSNGAADR